MGCKGKKYFHIFADMKSKFLLAIGVVLLALIIFFLKSTGNTSDTEISSNDIDTEEIPVTPLNMCLTNSMSDISESKNMDRIINKFMWRWHITGASLAVVKEGKLVYAKGYGWADREEDILMSPSNIFRVASLSKLITAAAIMKLCEDGFLSLDEKVFGPGAILDEAQFSVIKDPRMLKITVEMLLKHTAGFSRSKGDPMFRTRDIMIWEDMKEVPDMDAMIAYSLTQKLGSNPGGAYRYSNLGYLILTKIIEVCSGMEYEQYCQKKILHPAGCWDMHLAHNMYEDKYPNEVRYYEDEKELVNSFDLNDQKLYPRTYGGSNVEGLIGGGAWVASPAEYVKFVCSIDGDDVIKDVLTEESVRLMTDTDDDNPHPLGWVNSCNGVWTRTGTLAGVSAMVRRLPDGTIWMFITNTSSWKGSKFTRYISTMMTDAFSRVTWPTDRDLFEANK